MATLPDAHHPQLRLDPEPGAGHSPGCNIVHARGTDCAHVDAVGLRTALSRPPAYEFVQAPKHYNAHPSGIECQVIIRECKDPLVAFAMKHLWRTQWGGKPGQTKSQDLQKVIEYCQLELAREAGKDRL